MKIIINGFGLFYALHPWLHNHRVHYFLNVNFVRVVCAQFVPEVFVEVAFKETAEDGGVYMAPVFVGASFEHINFIAGEFYGFDLFEQTSIKIIYTFIIAGWCNARLIHFIKEAANQIIRACFLLNALFNNAREDFIGQQSHIF